MSADRKFNFNTMIEGMLGIHGMAAFVVGVETNEETKTHTLVPMIRREESVPDVRSRIMDHDDVLSDTERENASLLAAMTWLQVTLDKYAEEAVRRGLKVQILRSEADSAGPVAIQATQAPGVA